MSGFPFFLLSPLLSFLFFCFSVILELISLPRGCCDKKWSVSLIFLTRTLVTSFYRFTCISAFLTKAPRFVYQLGTFTEIKKFGYVMNTDNDYGETAISYRERCFYRTENT